MATKKRDPSHLREVVNNASPVGTPVSNGGDSGGRPAHPSTLPPLSGPIIAIGMDGNVRYYLDKRRQLVALPVGRHTALELMGLYCDDVLLFQQHFPRYSRDGKVTGADARAAHELHLAHSGRRLWSPTEKARGRGCWSDGDGRLFVNTGTAVFLDGEWHQPGLFGDYVLVAREAIMHPVQTAEAGGATGAAAEILALFQTWNWRRPLDARLCLGWVVCAFFGAALPIRPVGWIIGPRRTGKSTLQETLNHLLGGWLISVLDPTFAAIRQTLKYDCLAVAIDEAESDEDQNNKRRLNDLVKLARLCFSGGKSPRGGSDGEATEYMLRSAVLFSSINRPALLPQDRSRMWLGRLAKLPPDYPAPPDLSPRRLRSLGTCLLRRAIDAWPRLAAARAQYRIALRAVGHEGRSAEVFATLLAAADIVLSDYPVDTDTAAEIAAELPFATLVEAEEDLSEEQGWLQWLLSCVIPLDGPGSRNTIAAWLRQSIKSTSLYDRQEADRILGQYGLKVIRPKGKEGEEPTHFAVADHGSGVERLHATHPVGGPGWHHRPVESRCRRAGGRGEDRATVRRLARQRDGNPVKARLPRRLCRGTGRPSRRDVPRGSTIIAGPRIAPISFPEAPFPKRFHQMKRGVSSWHDRPASKSLFLFRHRVIVTGKATRKREDVQARGWRIRSPARGP
jgi:hypothetical protein